MNKPIFTSHSQVGQDQWVYDRLGAKGFFVDIGSGHPFENNNTYALEQVGWRGLMIDRDDHVAQLSRSRSAGFIHGDAITIDWRINGVPKVVDYLSLDVDENTPKALERFLEFSRFRMATIEHDSYRFGGGPRDSMRNLLKAFGYKLEHADVEDQGLPFEDWWVAP